MNSGLDRLSRSKSYDIPLEAKSPALYAGRVAKQDKKTKKGGKGEADKNERVIAENRKARHNYTVLDTLECGIVLVGSEVKSLRTGQLSLDEAYGKVDKDEVWLLAANIAEYSYSHAPQPHPQAAAEAADASPRDQEIRRPGLRKRPHARAAENVFQGRQRQGADGHLQGQAAARQARVDEEARDGRDISRAIAEKSLIDLTSMP